MKPAGPKKGYLCAATAAAILLAMLLVLLCGLSSAPQRNWDAWGRHEKQYEELTAAIAAGQLPLLEEPAAFLAEMENPYDPAARSIAAAEAESYALIDTAYYNGKYYVYFGVTPALLLFLPAYLLFHRMLPTWVAVLLCAMLCVPAAFLLIRVFCRRFFPHVTAGLRIPLALSLIGTLGIPYLAAFCTTYAMPSVMGLLLTMLGLSCFLSAERPDGRMRRPLLTVGSVLLALTIGCRPVLAASFLLLFPIFGDAIRRGAFFRRRRDALVNTAVVLLPAFLLGGGFLLYNALRFDNPLEFGFRYLLTTRDLLHGNRTPGETFAGARLLLLELPRLRRVFPFMDVVDYAGQYQETLYVEPMFGGLLALHPLLPVGLVCFMALAPRRLTRLLSLSLWSLVLGVLILLVDASLAGISQRYESDFALFFFLPAATAFLCAGERFGALILDGDASARDIASLARALAGLLVFCALALALLEVVFSFAEILCDGRYFAMRDWNPEVYRHIAAFFSRSY